MSVMVLFSFHFVINFLIDSKEFHIFQRKEMKWFCNSYLTKYNRSGYMKNILPNDHLNEPATDQERNSIYSNYLPPHTGNNLMKI